MEWDQLSFLGPGLQTKLREVYRDVGTLYFAFEDLVTAGDVLEQCMSADEFTAHGERISAALLAWRNRFSSRASSHVNFKCHSSFSHLQHPNLDSERSVTETLENIMEEDPRFMLDLVKRQLKRKREDSTLQRADLERTQRDRFALQLAAFLKESCLPVSLQLEVLDDPNKGWIRIFGARRSKTLRNRYRDWNRFRSWMVAYNGHVWPRELKVLIDYVEESINLGCSMSLPLELQAALTVLEQVGRVPEDRMFSKDPTWLGHLASWKEQLESQSRAPVSAKPYTTALLLSLELYLLDLANERYFRFVAFAMLISAWTAMRVDDVQNIFGGDGQTLHPGPVA